MVNRFWRCTGLSTALGAVVMIGGCSSGPADTGSEDVIPNVQVVGTGTTKPGAGEEPRTGQGSVDGPLEEMGTWRGHWDGKRLTFSPVDEKATTSGIRPQGFVMVDDTAGAPKFDFATDEAIVVNNRPADPICAANAAADPGIYFTTASRPFGGIDTCTSPHLCSTVTVTNISTRRVDTVYLEVTSITPGFFGDNSAAVPTGYPLSNALGLWSYPSLNPGGFASQRLDFFLPSCEDFTFTIRVMGTLRRTSYGAGESFMEPGEFIDACNEPGMTRVLVNQGPGVATGNLGTPFPFTLYDFTFNATTGAGFRINTSGAIGFAGSVTGSNTTLPSSFNRVLFPFWDNIQTGADGVCYVRTGSAPNRRFVVTWKNVSFADAPSGTLTFSAVLHESTDDVVFQYADCSESNARINGDSATIGVQGPSGASTLVSFNSELIPPFCANGYKVTLTAQPGNSL